ncbi:hypothetical protein DL93DRAFT_2084364 [Clavulina sp. PMI_390]|nr:hypothetical protein DL93DRAFT_2084364 [Clavulina sp. PMI_390]
MERVVPHGATIDSTAPIRLDAVLPTSTNGSSRRGFSRIRISKIFGGGRQATISNPSEEKVILNNTSNLCIRPNWNPWGPSQPGKDGVLFLPPEGMFKDVPSPEPNGVTLFCWNGMNNWIYLGQYRACRAAELSTDEWAALDETTKTVWFRKANLMKQWRDAINVLTPGRTDDTITKDTFNAAMSLGVTVRKG